MALMRRLLAALVRIMEPPLTKQRKIMYRSAPLELKRKTTPPPTPPSNEELVYLTYFTNYCEKDDHHDFRSQYPDDFDLTFKPRIQRQPRKHDDDGEEVEIKREAEGDKEEKKREKEKEEEDDENSEEGENDDAEDED